MPVEWLSLTKIAKECGMNYRTYKNNYLDETKYPPDRISGKSRYWLRINANKMIRDVIGEPIQEADNCTDNTSKA